MKQKPRYQQDRDVVVVVLEEPAHCALIVHKFWRRLLYTIDDEKECGQKKSGTLRLPFTNNTYLAGK